MPFSFPSNPSIGQTSVQNERTYQWDGYAWNLVSNISLHSSTHSSSGADPITINSSQISDFNNINIINSSNLYLWSNFK